MMDFVLAGKSVPELPVRREPSQGEMMPNLWGVFEDEGLAFRLDHPLWSTGRFCRSSWPEDAPLRHT